MKTKKKNIKSGSRILAIMGSNGEGKDYNMFSSEKWNESKRILLKIVKENSFEEIISGGSTFIEHLAVQMFNKGLVKKLHLELPCSFNKKEIKFEDKEDFDTSNKINYYHEIFSQKFLIDSRKQLIEAINKKALVEICLGFFDRDSKIISKATDLAVFSFKEAENTQNIDILTYLKNSFANKHPNGKIWRVDLNKMDVFTKN